ncbi:MAG: MFS transporter, partial [Verrucomicrobia bacterium]
ADRISRWIIVGSAVILWSVASGGSGLAATFTILFATRIFVGIGEGGYGPAAPTILADLFPIDIRGRVMAIFYTAIPVGSALGYVIGGVVGGHLGWRWAFYLVTLPGLLLGLLCFWQRDPRV